MDGHPSAMIRGCVSEQAGVGLTINQANAAACNSSNRSTFNPEDLSGNLLLLSGRALDEALALITLGADAVDGVDLLALLGGKTQISNCSYRSGIPPFEEEKGGTKERRMHMRDLRERIRC